MLYASVAIFFRGCTRSPESELKTLKHRVDAHKVQAWAKEILEKYPTNTVLYPYFEGIAISSRMIILSNPPAFLGDLAVRGWMGPSIVVSSSEPSSNRCVSLLYAESFGFGGPGYFIVAGGESFRQATNAGCLEWIPGVYYQYTHSP